MCGHRVQFYDSDAFLIRKVFEFVDAALRDRRAAVVIATGPHLTELKSLLGADGWAGAASEQLSCIDAEGLLARFMVDGLPDPARFESVVGGLLAEASNHGRRRVAAFGEMVALLYAAGNAEAALRLERLWEGLAARQAFDELLCAYPMSAFPDETHRAAFQLICQAHGAVAPIEQVETATDDPAALHRVIARLQQSTNSLEHEIVQRREADRALDLQAERISSLERTQAVLKNLAGHDALTGLANRRAFTDRLAHAFARARRSGGRLSLLFVDLDGFKTLNDRHGHDAGDRLLTQVAARLLRCVRASDTVCRLGGDEFTVLMEDADAAEATLLAQRVVDAFGDRFVLGNDRVELTASVGIGRYPDDAADARGLMRSADRAMYRAKTFGKGRHASLDTPSPASHGACAPVLAGHAAAVDAAVDASGWMTVEAVALKLGLSRPHVVKLVAEQRFGGQVMHQAGALPLISSNAVSRLAEALAHA